MRCAIVDIRTRIVTEIVVADPSTDKAPDGCELVPLADDVACGPGWMCSNERGPIMTAEIRAKIAEQERIDANHPDVVMIRSIETDPTGFLDRVEADNG